MTSQSPPSARRAASALISAAGLPEAANRVTISGADDLYLSPFRVGAAAAASVAAATAAVGAVATARTARPQHATVDATHAAAAFESERRATSPRLARAELWDPLAGNYATSDGWIRLHTNLSPHRAAALGVLDAPANRRAVERACRDWPSRELENAVTAAGGVAAAMRTLSEWDAHPQAAATRDRPPVVVEPRRTADPLRLNGDSEPLTGLRVLDLTRIIAGPVCARFLAAYGATVLRVDAPHLEDGIITEADTSIGKLRCSLDLREPGDRQRFDSLARTADVIVHSSRPGALARLGYNAEVLDDIAPSAVIGHLSAYAGGGPWHGRRGFDSVVQVATGIAHACGYDERSGPGALPVQALDHASGYLLALGVAAAVHRRIRDGSVSFVQVSLETTGQWLRALGPGATVTSTRPGGDCNTTLASDAYGPLSVVTPPGALTDHWPYWHSPPVPRATHPAKWPDQSSPVRPALRARTRS